MAVPTIGVTGGLFVSQKAVNAFAHCRCTPSPRCLCCRRVDVDALHLALVLGQQRFEGFEVVAVDNHIAGVGCDAEGIFAVEYTIGHIQMVRNDLFFTNPIDPNFKLICNDNYV